MTEQTPRTTRQRLCCGEHPVGVAEEPLKLSCQLCPNSPTYWRGTGPPTNGEVPAVEENTARDAAQEATP